MDWLEEALDQFDDDEYLIIDCPGQIELYTHIPVMNKIIDQLRTWGYGDNMVSVFIVDATFITDPSKFISGSLLALSAMIAMQLPHVNVLSKCDLVEEASMERVLEMESALQLWDVLGDGGGGSGPFPSLQAYQHIQPVSNDNSATDENNNADSTALTTIETKKRDRISFKS